MRRLLNLDVAPPVDGEGNSFRYVFPEDGFVAVASDYWTWGKKIKEHAEGNSLTIPDMAVAEDQLCGTLPPDRCQYQTGDAQPINIEFSFSDVGNWIKAIVSRFVSGEEFVSQAEAERRAAICVRCPLNTQVSSGCGGGCEKLAEMLTPGMAKRQTLWDSKLKSCAVCHCYNRVQLHFPLTILREYDTPERQAAYPDFCWKKNGAHTNPQTTE